MGVPSTLLSKFRQGHRSKHRRVCDPTTRRCLSGQQTTIASLGLIAQQPMSSFLRLLEEFPSLTHTTDSPLSLEHNAVHHIETRGPPVFSRVRRLTLNLLRIAKRELDQMICLGIVHPSKSARTSALHMGPRRSPEAGAPVAITGPLMTVPDLAVPPCFAHFSP